MFLHFVSQSLFVCLALNYPNFIWDCAPSDIWDGLDTETLFDIFCVKKAHKFSSEQRTDYLLEDCINDITSAQWELGGLPFNLWLDITSDEFKQGANSVSFYPSWLIDDDIFKVMQWAFASSYFVKNLQKQLLKGTKTLNIRFRVIPRSIVSLYDNDRTWNLKGFIERFVDESGVNSCVFQMVPMTRNLSVDDKFNLIQSVYDSIVWQNASEFQNDIVLLIDRRKCSKLGTNGHEKLWVFQCANKKALDSLDGALFGLDFEIGDVVKSWCRFSECQRIRFFPEYVTSLIPRFFVSPNLSPMDYVMKIYDSDFKHQWRVSLDDPAFNKYYKAITGDDHISNNYHREWRIEHDMDSDAVLSDLVETDDTRKQPFVHDTDSNFAQWTERVRGGTHIFLNLKTLVMRWKKMECDRKHGRTLDLKDCHHLEVVIRHLRAFQEIGHSVSVSHLAQFNLGQIIESIDHIVADHQLMDSEKRAEIHRYVTSQVACEKMATCHALSMYKNRARERTDSVCTESDSPPPDRVEIECEIINDTMNSVHALLLHRDQSLRRGSHQRFSTDVMEMEEKKEDWDSDEKDSFKPIAVEFGMSVLKWIPIGERPYFRSLRDEIVNNKDSPIDEESFERYLIECIEKMKGTTYSLREILALKLYTDTTAFTSFLRKAHWTRSSASMRKMYYFWASAVYEAALYHSAPIPSVDGKSPQTLYHGLNRMLTVSDEQPKYHGPFSVSTLRTVAHRFSKETGMYFRIMPSYSDALQCCTGINMDTISSFKEEREILLVDQYIPIRSTKTFQSKQSVLVDLLMFTVKGRSSEIRDRGLFFRKLGIHFDWEWKSLIKEHSELFELSAFGGRLVIARLYMELDIWSDDWVPMKVNKETADNDLLIYCVEGRHDERLLPLYRVLMSKFKVFQSHTLKYCWKVEFTDMNADGNKCFADSEYLINRSRAMHGLSWLPDWPTDTVIDRIECRNRKLFGDKLVWVQEFDAPMDADLKNFVVPKSMNDKWNLNFFCTPQLELSFYGRKLF